MTEQPARVGEIIEASTTDFVAQCYQLYQSPPLGSLVKTGDQPVTLYGIVYYTATTSLEPGRRPIARGRDEASEEAVYRSSPQLAKLLRTEFTGIVVGHKQEGELFYYLPSQPARIHGFVYGCSREEVLEFSRSFDFLNILVNARLPISMDELVAAALRRMSQAQEDRHAFLVAAGKEMAVLLSGQFHQLKAILGRIRE